MLNVGGMSGGKFGATLGDMHPAWSIALVTLGAIAGVLLGIVAGPAGVIPPTLVAAWQVWHGHRELAELKRRTRPKTTFEQRREDEARRQRDYFAELTAGRSRYP